MCNVKQQVSNVQCEAAVSNVETAATYWEDFCKIINEGDYVKQ